MSIDFTKTRPQYVKNDHLEYLDQLREDGIVNMFGAAALLRDEFPDLTSGTARSVLAYWMQSFGKEKR